MTIALPHRAAPQTGASPFEPILENRPSSFGPGPLRIVAFNAHRGSRFSSILRCFANEPLRSASIILLSEAARATWFGGCQVAKELAAALNMSYAYVPDTGHLGTKGKIISFVGNAILARGPLEHLVAIALPTVSIVRRSRNLVSPDATEIALHTTIRIRGLAIAVCVAHLDSRTGPLGRERQIAAVLERLPREGPAIFGGDLNTTTVELARPASVKVVVREMLLDPRRFRDPHRTNRSSSASRRRVSRREAPTRKIAGTFAFARIVPRAMPPKLDWLALRGFGGYIFFCRVTTGAAAFPRAARIRL